MITFFYLIVLIFSVMLHEIAHGYMALRFGDTTAKDEGRLTLNPAKHIDPMGSIVVPLLLAIAKAPVFGWAKPVPYDPRRLKNPKKQSGLIALAGPLTNFAVAIIFAVLARLLIAAPDFGATLPLFLLFNVIIQTNLALAFFNLLPIPPLDGGGILVSVLPHSFAPLISFLYRYGIFILLFLIFSGLDFLGPLIIKTHLLLVGQDFLGL